VVFLSGLQPTGPWWCRATNLNTAASDDGSARLRLRSYRVLPWQADCSVSSTGLLRWANVSKRGRTMNTASQIQTFNHERHTASKLVTTIRETAEAIATAIEVEERRTRSCDLRDPCYSILARSMRARLDNLKVTIAILEAKAAG